MRLKSWVSNFGLAIVAGVAIAIASGVRVQTQQPFLVFGTNSSGVAQPINSTSNALWVSLQGGPVQSPLTFPNGTVSAPSITFTSDPDTGFWWGSSGRINITNNGSTRAAFNTAGLVLSSANGVGFASGDASANDGETTITRPAAGNLLLSGTAVPLQLRTTQGSVPTCTTNCGTPGNVCVGTDTAMICTMGTTPASGFVLNFSAAWAAAPACTAVAALAGMATGKKPLTVVSSTTIITIVTDGTAPVAGDKYAVTCIGVQ